MLIQEQKGHSEQYCVLVKMGTQGIKKLAYVFILIEHRSSSNCKTTAQDSWKTIINKNKKNCRQKTKQWNIDLRPLTLT